MTNKRPPYPQAYNYDCPVCGAFVQVRGSDDECWRCKEVLPKLPEKALEWLEGVIDRVVERAIEKHVEQHHGDD